MRESEEQYKMLIILAWAMEIIAATIGLAVAITFGYQSYNYQINQGSLSTAAYISIMLGTLPFIMIAFAEILKIPIAKIIYDANKVSVRIIYSIIIVAITILTFETIMLGLERQYHNITIQVTDPLRKVSQHKEKIINLEDRLKRIQELTPEKMRENFNAKIQIAEDNYQASKKLEDDNFNENKILDTSFEGATIKALQKDREDLKTRFIEKKKDIRNKISETRDEKRKKSAELATAKDTFFGTNDPADIIRKQIKTLDDDEKIYKDERKQIEVQYNQELLTLDNKIKELQSELNRKESSRKSKKDYKSAINILKNKRKKDLEAIDKENKELEKQIKNDRSNVRKIKTEISNFKENIEVLNSTIDKAASESQIYRLAMIFQWAFRDEGELKAARPSDITRDEADTVAMWWFGSVSLIVSTLGAALAFGYFILNNQEKIIKSTSNKKPPSSSINRAFRLVLRALRKRLKEPKIITKIREKEVPKEVIKEIAVEKIVIKEVEKEVPVDRIVLKEVPVEVVSKEIIYTPLWTNDPDRLKFGKTKVENITSEKKDEEEK
jgi:hypothetical protein